MLVPHHSANDIDDICCGTDGERCATGIPVECSASCAVAFHQFTTSCQPTLDKIMPPGSDRSTEIERFENVCIEAADPIFFLHAIMGASCPDSAPALQLTYTIGGGEQGGGIHIHTGSSCASADAPGGHFFQGSTDPWPASVVVCEACPVQPEELSGVNVVDAGGLTLSDVNGRTVVVHASDGERIACGVISDGTAVLAPYPNPNPSLNPLSATTGVVEVSDVGGAAAVPPGMCQFDIDSCGVCGGDGTSCLTEAEYACADGSDEEVWPEIGVAVCEGHFEGSIEEAGADALCNAAAGWHVCNGQDMVDSGFTYSDGRSFEGCYVYNAANDCHGCFSSCTGATSVNGNSGCHDQLGGHDIAGIGSACADRGAGSGGSSACVSGGRIDGGSHGTG